MAAMIEGKPAKEWFKDAAQRQKRSNAYASYEEPKKAEPERKEGRIPEIKAASPMPAPKKQEPVKAAPAAAKEPAKPAPPKPTEPPKSARQKMIEKAYSEAQEISKAAKERQASLAKAAVAKEEARKRNIEAAKEEVRQAKPALVKAGDAVIKEAGDTAASIASGVSSGLSSLSDLTRKFAFGDTERQKKARERLRKAQEL